MKPHCWIEWRKPRRIAVFVAALVAIAFFWSHVVTGLRDAGAFVGRRGGLSNFVGIMFIGWVGGWFLLLFVRAEDLSFTSYPYQSACRAIGGLMILAGVASAAFLTLAFK